MEPSGDGLGACLYDEVLMFVHIGCASTEVWLRAGAIGVHTPTSDIPQITPNKRQWNDLRWQLRLF